MSKKTNFLKEIREADIAKLNKDLAENYAKLRDLRFDLGFGKINNLKSIRAVKKQIAQILTVIKEKSSNK